MRIRFIRRNRFVAGIVAMLMVTVLPGSPVIADTSGTLLIDVNTTLAQDHRGNIVIVEEGVTLDCGGHNVRGDGSGVGINVQADGVTVTGCEVVRFDVGILSGFDETLLLGNTAAQNNQGINLAGTTDSNAVGNTADKNSLWGILVSQGASDNTIQGNSANNNGLVGIAINTSAGNLFYANVANANGVDGINSLLSSLNEFVDNTTMNNGRGGFEFAESSGNIVTQNTSSNNGTPGLGTGFNFNNSSNNYVAGNLAQSNEGNGFHVFFGSQLNVFENNRSCHSFFFDGLDASTGEGNTWINNNFCTTQGF